MRLGTGSNAKLRKTTRQGKALRTDRPTDTVTYRVACKRLKMKAFPFRSSHRCPAHSQGFFPIAASGDSIFGGANHVNCGLHGNIGRILPVRRGTALAKEQTEYAFEVFLYHPSLDTAPEKSKGTKPETPLDYVQDEVGYLETYMAISF